MEAVNAGLDERLFSYLQKSIKETAYYKLLGVELQLLSPGLAEIRVVSAQSHTNPMGIIHGGLITSLADAAMGNAIRSLGVTGVTVDFSTSLIAGARLGETIVARGKVSRLGKNIIFANAMIYAGDKLIAESKGTFYKIADINY